MTHALRRIVEHYNETHKPIALTPHVLRHTFCTRMAQAGMPVKELQYLMGHADVGTTLNINTHMSYDAAEKSMRKNRPERLNLLHHFYTKCAETYEKL